jgi:meiotically up-regulated gene 157 (Mug157) protein
MSPSNRYFYSGSLAKGIGSPHTPSGNVWHMAIIMQGLTTTNKEEIKEVFKMIEDTDAGTEFVHESFNPSNPSSFSRHWFAWANSLFSELVLEHLDVL